MWPNPYPACRSLDMTWPLGTESYFGYLSKADLNNEAVMMPWAAGVNS